MFVKWLREHASSAAILTLFRLYLGYAWITAGWHKIVDGFDATGFLKGALAKASGEHPAVQSWWAAFIEHFALPNVGLFNVLVPWGELLVGIALTHSWSFYNVCRINGSSHELCIHVLWNN